MTMFSDAEAIPETSRSGTQCRAVVGLQWGDEGKGKAVDVLAADSDAVVRYNGGANAGHSVVVGGEKFALHLVPSGILYPGVLSVIGSGVVVDPQQLFKELDALAARGVDVSEVLVSNRAHVVMPYHKTEDRLREMLLQGEHGQKGTGGGKGKGEALGTTLRGIGPCYADKVQRAAAVRIGDLDRPDVLAERVRLACALKGAMFRALLPEGDAGTELNVDDLIAWAQTYGKRLRGMVGDTGARVRSMLAQGKRVLMEGANATLLDVDHGTYPFVTSSSTTACGIPSGAGVPPSAVGEILGVLKAYQTRVGAGPMPTELLDTTGERLREQGFEYGTTTGRPRRCGWLDLVAARYAVDLNGISSICVTKLDVLSGFETLEVCTGYTIDGEPVDEFPQDARELGRVAPVYERVPGFSGDLTTCRRFEDLPEGARAYIGLIERALGRAVSMVSVGPERSQTIVRN